GGWTLALGAVALPRVAVAIAVPGAMAALLTGDAAARHAAADLLPWFVAGAALQIYAGLLASALAALDDYTVAAGAFAAGAIANLVVIVALLDHGVVVFGWGAVANGAVAAGVPLLVAATRGAVGHVAVGGIRHRLRALAAGAVALHVLAEWALREAFGLAGVAVGMAVTTLLVLGVITAALHAARRVARGLALAAALCGGLALVVFLVPRAVVGPVP